MKKILQLSFLFVFAVGISNSWAQERSVSGTITSIDEGDGIPGVNVVIKGTTNGTISDFDGNFKINVSDGAILVFSFIGYATEEVEVGARSVIDVSLTTDVHQLSEVVVTALGVERETKALGYSVQEVSAESMSQAREANVLNSLSGKVAGVQVTGSSGATGSSSRVVLRGPTSLTGNNQPLFVVDGVPIDNTSYADGMTPGMRMNGGGFDQPSGASDINPDDVESITVLKGANAAALYGSRASNGVIIITTKKGKKGSGIGVSINSSTQFMQTLKTPSFQNSYGQGGNQNTFEWVDGQNSDGGVDESWGMPLDVGLEAVQFSSNGESAEPWISHPDNIKDFYQTGVLLSNNVALTGGNDNGSFRLSITNSQEDGIVPNTSLDRNAISMSAKYDLSDKLYADFTVNYYKMNSDNLPTGGYTNDNPVQQMIWSGRQVDFAALEDYESLPLAADHTAAGGTPLNWNTRFQNNPYWVQDNNLNKLEKDKIVGNVKMGYKVADWFTVQGKLMTDVWAGVERYERAAGSNEFPEGSYQEIFRTRYETNKELLMMFNKDFSGEISTNLTVGGNQMRQHYNRIRGTATQLELPGVYNLGNAKSGVPAVLSNTKWDLRLNSLFFAGGISYKNYVFLEFTGRNDWASVLPEKNNSFFYPSVSVSAIVTDIANIQSDVLSFLKVRGGWASVGGYGPLNPYQLEQTFSFRATPYGTTLLPYDGGVLGTLNNPEIEPEFTNSIEAGIDARFLNGRITLDATYYNSISKNLVVPAEVTGASGYLQVLSNIGEMSNKGVELMLGATVLEMGEFKWDVTLNWAKNINEVVTLGGDLESLDLGGQWGVTIQARQGEPYGSLFGPVMERDPDGNVIYNNGNPVIAAENQTIGDTQPDWIGSIGTELSWKGIKLSALIDAKMGGEIHSMTYTWGQYAGVLDGSLDGRETGIIGKGVVDNGDGTYSPNDVVVPAETYYKHMFDNGNVESAVLDASYVKFRQAQLSYTLPNSLLGNLPFKDVSVGFVGRNLAILYSTIPHIDPETAFNSDNGEQGQEFGQLPSTRSYGFNINFKF